jgi:hypothetical protein
MISLILNYLRDLLRPRRDLFLENLALRHQILVLRRDNPKPPFSPLDRAFWVVLYRKWENWRRPLALVKHETVRKPRSGQGGRLALQAG